MTVLLAILAGLVGAVVGWGVTSILAVYIMGYYGVSDFEGARGMLAFLGIGPIGGLVTMIVAIVLVARYRGNKGKLGKVAGITLASFAGIGLLALAGIYVLQESNPWISTNAAAPRLNYEIRLPAGITAPTSQRAFQIELHTDQNTMPSSPSSTWLRMDGERAILVGHVEVAYRTSKRSLVLKIDGQPARIFFLGLPANPPAMADFGAWKRVDFVDDGKQDSRPALPPAGETTELRFRLERFDR